MRLTISTKLFIGFLCVIFLNIIYVVIVNKLSDLNGIAHILKRQEEVKNQLLQVASLQSDKRRSRTSFEAIGKRESVENFKQSSLVVKKLLDTINIGLNVISVLDSAVFRKDINSMIHYENHIGLLTLMDTAAQYNTQYDISFAQFVITGKDGSPVVKDSLLQKSAYLMALTDTADTKLTSTLKSIGLLIDEQTKIVIKDTERRINDIKQMTIVILFIVIAVASGFAFFFSRFLTTSLRRLKESASLIGKGNFTVDPIGYPSDEIGDLANAFHDMAVDLKNTQEELVKSKRLAAIGEVVASVNHEINNPLMIISGNAQFLEMSMKDFPPEMQERVRVILEETERISNVTKKLREIRNPVAEDYTSSGEQMINLDRSTK